MFFLPVWISAFSETVKPSSWTMQNPNHSSNRSEYCSWCLLVRPPTSASEFQGCWNHQVGVREFPLSKIKVHFIHILLFLLTFNRLIHFDPLKNGFFIPHFHDPNLPKSKMVIWPMTKMLNPEDLGYTTIRWDKKTGSDSGSVFFCFFCCFTQWKNTPWFLSSSEKSIRTSSTPRRETELPAWILGVCDFGCHSGLCFSDISDLVKLSTRKAREIPMIFFSHRMMMFLKLKIPNLVMIN